MSVDQGATRQWRATQHAAQLHLDAAPDRVVHWTSQDAEYQEEFLSVSHLLADMADLSTDKELLSLRNQPVRIPLNERVMGWWPKLAVVASVVLVAVFGLWMFGQQTVQPGVSMERYVTRVGEQKEIHLRDGSVVTLNTGSELLVGLSDKGRKLILRRGEAYFDVAGDARRPFSVDAGLRSVTVLGTEFNIRKTPDQLQVAVSEGVLLFTHRRKRC